MLDKPCPNCGHKSLHIFECEKCGTTFCEYCHPEQIEGLEEDGSLTVICGCGSAGIFV